MDKGFESKYKRFDCYTGSAIGSWNCNEKSTKKVRVFLWAIVGLRILIPVGITTSIDWFQKVPDKVEQSIEKSVENKSPTQKEVKVESAEITEGKITNAESQNSQSVSANSSQTVTRLAPFL